MDIFKEVKYIIKATIKVKMAIQKFVYIIPSIMELSINIPINFGKPKIEKNSTYPIIYDFSPE